MAALANLLISWDAYTAFGGLVTVPVMLAVILAMLVRIGISRDPGPSLLTGLACV